MYLNRNCVRKLLKTTRTSENVILRPKRFFQSVAFFLAGSAYKHIGNGVRKWAGRRPPMSKIHQNDYNLTLFRKMRTRTPETCNFYEFLMKTVNFRKIENYQNY